MESKEAKKCRGGGGMRNRDYDWLDIRVQLGLGV